MSLGTVPLSEVTKQDVQVMDFIQTVQDINFVNKTVKQKPLDDTDASTYVLKEYCERFVWNIIRRCKQRRLGLEQRWLEIQRMVVKMHDTNQHYKGHSKAYIPVYKRNRTTLVSNIIEGLFPSDEYFDVVDREQGENDEAKACKSVIQYEFEESDLETAMEGFVGQYVDFGISVLKGIFKKDVSVQGTNPTGQNPFGMEYTQCEGLEVDTRSMFNVICYPEHVNKKAQLLVEAERMECPLDYVNQMHQNGRWENVREALQGGQKGDEFDWVNTATLSDVANIPNTMELRDEKGSPVESVIVVEAWCRLLLPKAAYAPGEPVRQVPCRVVFVNGMCVLVTRNPYHHQQSPFLYARDNQIVGSFYSDGAGADTQGLQYLANDHFNQLNDCMTYGMMPMWMVNPNYVAGPMDTQRPGRVFKVRDVEKAMKSVSPDIGMVQYGHMHTMNVVSMAQDAPGAPKIMQGQGSGKTATSDQIAQHNAQGPMGTKVKSIEKSVMRPLMEMTWSMNRQFRSVEFIRQLGERPMKYPAIDPTNGMPHPMAGQPVMDPQTGQPVMEADMVRFLPKDVNIKPRFRMLSSSQAANRQARQQGLTLFTDLAGKLGPNLQLLGKMLNPVEVLQRGWNDGLGNRGFDRVIIPMPMAPAGMLPPGGAPSPKGPPPVGAVPQGNVPGAANNEPVAGEGDVLKPIMDNAQAQNANSGKFNTPGGLAGGQTPY